MAGSGGGGAVVGVCDDGWDGGAVVGTAVGVAVGDGVRDGVAVFSVSGGRFAEG